MWVTDSITIWQIMIDGRPTVGDKFCTYSGRVSHDAIRAYCREHPDIDPVRVGARYWRSDYAERPIFRLINGLPETH